MGANHPDVIEQLQQVMQEEAKTIWEVSHAEDPACIPYAKTHWGGFYGPWLEMPSVEPPEAQQELVEAR